ncbi:unnamed protein product, partial [Allacma fusca]
FEDLFEKKVQLISADRKEIWRDQFQEIMSDIVTAPEFEMMKDISSWVTDVINYNTPHGKGIRAYQVILSDMYLCNDKSSENDQAVNRLAWMMEMKHGGACILDDLMDESETRRDRLCWYKVDKLNNYQMYNTEFYKDMMMFKNGYYTFYMPVAVAMIKNGISDKVKLKEVEKISLEISVIYSIQDDFMDCFVDPKLTGKVGTDIEDGKCSWLFVQAMERCSSKQRRVLLDNYRSKDPVKVDIIKRLYMDIGIPELYKMWEEEAMIKVL